MLDSKFKNEFKMLLIYLFNLVANSSAEKQITLAKRRCKSPNKQVLKKELQTQLEF